MSQKLLTRQAEMIKVFAEFGFTRQQLAVEYGVHPDTIRNILRGTSFAGEGSRRKDRKLSDDQVRQIRAWAAEGHKEQKIAGLLGNVISRSTVRQVIVGKSYQDVI